LGAAQRLLVAGMADIPIVVIGASAGGLEPLKTVVGALPADFPGAVFVVMHLAARGFSALPEILTKASKLPALHPEDGEPIRAARIYCGQPNCHLLVEKDSVAVTHGPLENRFRPSIDALFRSAAYNHGSNVTGVVLSGLLYDGTSGLWSIKRLGGTTVVQDPHDSKHDSMPLSALKEVDIDHCLAASGIGALLVRLTRKPPVEAAPRLSRDERNRLDAEVRIAAGEFVFRKERFAHGEISPYTCPDCHGALIEIDEGGVSRFRCHTGHAYSSAALLSGISDMVEASLVETIRALEEGVMLLEDIAAKVSEREGPAAAASYLAKAKEAQARARMRHDLVSAQSPLAKGTPLDDGPDAGKENPRLSATPLADC
jgi:two-component system, chemotaxis family, protein-glutamate methylesterase/glutaminase